MRKNQKISVSPLLVCSIYVLGALFAAGCVPGMQLPGGTMPMKPNPPNIKVSTVQLVSAPTNEALAFYACPQIAGKLVCRLLGRAPSVDELKFVFDLVLNVENNNSVPLPGVEALVAFTAFPANPAQAKVGAVCVALCPEGEMCGAPPVDGCTGGDQGLKTKEDYANAAVGFLIANATGQAKMSDLKVRMIPANTNIDVRVRLELSPQQMAKLIIQLSKDSMDQVKRGKIPAIEIPYEIEGTFWVNVQNFGKIAADFGPFRQSWRLK